MTKFSISDDLEKTIIKECHKYHDAESFVFAISRVINEYNLKPVGYPVYSDISNHLGYIVSKYSIEINSMLRFAYIGQVDYSLFIKGKAIASTL